MRITKKKRTTSHTKTRKKTAIKVAGRRTVLNDELVDRIVERVGSCFYLKHAIESLGRTERVLYKWFERGEAEIESMEKGGRENPDKNEAIFVRLVTEVRKAQAENIRDHAKNIQKSALGQPAEYLKDAKGNVVVDSAGNPVVVKSAVAPNWYASARYLEAVDHERWGRKVRNEITTPEGGPTELRITVLPRRDVPKEYDDSDSARTKLLTE